MAVHSNKTSSSFILFVLGFLLFLEWLRPLTEITETGHLGLFMMFSAYTFFLSYMQLPVIVAFPIKLAMVLYVLHVLFYSGPLLELSWVAQFIEILKSNLLLCLQLEFAELTAQFRTFLFLIVLWLVSYLMFYWIVHLRKITLFFILTITFIGVIDTFTFYEGDDAILRAVIIGFILIGILHILRVKEREGIVIETKRIMQSWVTALVIILLISTSVAHALPKYSPQWPDPIPFITSYSEDADEGEGVGNGSLKSSVQKSGYGEDDSRLGGPFKFDNTPIFTTEVQELHYWRVESKDMYSGKGWEVTGDNVINQLKEDEVSFQLYNSNVATEKLTAEVHISKDKTFNYLLNPGQLTSFNDHEEGKTLVELQYNNGRFAFVNKNGSSKTVPSYSLSYDMPQFSIKELRNSDQSYPEEVERKYLQLPETLPDRVSELAKEIVKGIDSPYDKAVAVETYFGSGGFVYDNHNVAVPGKNDDYVDQFLFETQRGYCDNYSTSMAVMLRTLGIPTRWVKGFTYGKYDDTLDDGFRRYKVTNADAHSWVEVYFSDVGWVPFEPTRGFNNVYDFVNDDDSTNETDDELDVDPKKDKEKDLEPDEEPASDNEKDEDEATGGVGISKNDNMSKPQKYLLGFLVIALIIGSAYLFVRRNQLRISFLLWRFRRRKDDKAFFEAYKKLLYVLNKCGYKRSETDTLRTYAAYVDQRLKTNKFTELTLLYEKGVYYKQSGSPLWQKSFDTWESILKSVQIRL